jgi:hypothetical protein
LVNDHDFGCGGRSLIVTATAEVDKPFEIDKREV